MNGILNTFAPVKVDSSKHQNSNVFTDNYTKVIGPGLKFRESIGHSHY